MHIFFYELRTPVIPGFIGSVFFPRVSLPERLTFVDLILEDSCSKMEKLLFDRANFELVTETLYQF